MFVKTQITVHHRTSSIPQFLSPCLASLSTRARRNATEGLATWKYSATIQTNIEGHISECVLPHSFHYFFLLFLPYLRLLSLQAALSSKTRHRFRSHSGVAVPNASRLSQPTPTSQRCTPRPRLSHLRCSSPSLNHAILHPIRVPSHRMSGVQTKSKLPKRDPNQ